MNITEAIRSRHSVRRYKELPIEEELLAALQEEIHAINCESGLHIRLVTDEPKAFGGRLAHYGHFSGVANYFALIGKKDLPKLQERCGYYGERLVLKAQTLGLHTCWVAVTYKKIPEALQMESGEKLTAVIAVGHGKSHGVKRKSKTPEQVSNLSARTPHWFRNGIESALLAPTAMNQQKFYLTYHDDRTVSAKAKAGPYAKMDLGIVKYHFEVGAGPEHFTWTD